MAIDNGGPAFAHPGNHVMSRPQEGMSLRDWFAGQALLGILNKGVQSAESVHLTAYLIADQMLAERKKDRG
jgi:hypothetical protein